MSTFTRRTYVCDPNTCDAWIEVTTKDNLNLSDKVWCPCGRKPSLVSEVDATILPTTERKEMQTEELQQANNRINLLEQRLAYQEKSIGQVLQNLTREGWYSDLVDKEEILRDLCEIFDHEPKQTVRITATVSVDVEYDIPLEEVDSFDAHYFLQDNLSIDSSHGDVIIQSWNVEDSQEEWQ